MKISDKWARQEAEIQAELDAIMFETSGFQVNRFEGQCSLTGKSVAAGEGFIRFDGSRWDTFSQAAAHSTVN